MLYLINWGLNIFLGATIGLETSDKVSLDLIFDRSQVDIIRKVERLTCMKCDCNCMRAGDWFSDAIFRGHFVRDFVHAGGKFD